VRHPTPIVALSLLLAALGLLWGSAGGGAASLPGGWEQVGANKAAPTQPALNGIVLALNTDQPGVMYVGGNFTDAGGDPNADYIARWDGSTWKALGVPKLNGQVTAIAYRNGKVYAGGTFTAAGGDTNAGFAAVWDGTKWSPVCKPSGPGGNVYALQISGSTIYIGGAFQGGRASPTPITCSRAT
jgi:trimeric autotransporter adhesin